MEKSPTTDKHLDIALTSDIKFRDIRNRAKKDEKERSRPKRKKKDKKEEAISKCNIDDVVIICSGMFDSKRRYGMAKIIDIQKSPRRDTFEYFGILLKTTDPDYIDRIGGLICFDQGDQYRWSWMYETTSIPPDTDSIKWLDKKEEYKPPKSEFERVGELAADGVHLVNLLERVYREHPQLQEDLFTRIFKDCRVFTLDSDQVTKLNQWFLGLKKREEGAIGGGLSYTFIPTGLGVVVKVKYFDEELDLSDYESW